MGLQDQLNARLKESMKIIPPQTAAIMAGAMEELKAAGITAHSKRKGDTAPDFKLPNAKGDMMSLSTLLEKGPVVISFYRGSW